MPLREGALAARLLLDFLVQQLKQASNSGVLCLYLMKDTSDVPLQLCHSSHQQGLDISEGKFPDGILRNCSMIIFQQT